MSALPTKLERLAISSMFHSMTAQDMGDANHALGKVMTRFERKYQGKYEGKGERSHLLESRQSK